MAYGGFKDLTRRTDSGKIFGGKAFNTAKNSKYDEYKRGLASMVHNFLIKKLLIVILKMRMSQKKNLAEELNNF